ncbi:alpha-L-rhamnosidase C-terminal domain-containing protein [Saccharothrix hoggarensis]|uniref:Alpha-L-rhamnosidase C-terminal domain-containing protein n=1 Tax=Saccharothrix hoggarensis TaxID=913853 RepID=A0ABW3QXM4_9PSEU
MVEEPGGEHLGEDPGQAWRRSGDVFALDVRVPVNAVADVVLPNRRRQRLGSEYHHLTSRVE